MVLLIWILKQKISAVNEGAVIGNDFHTIDVGAGGLIATNAGNGVLMLGFDSTALSNVLPSPSPADRTLRSDGTNWVQSTTVTNTTSGFFVRAINNPPVTLATPQSSLITQKIYFRQSILLILYMAEDLVYVKMVPFVYKDLLLLLQHLCQ